MCWRPVMAPPQRGHNYHVTLYLQIAYVNCLHGEESVSLIGTVSPPFPIPKIALTVEQSGLSLAAQHPIDGTGRFLLRTESPNFQFRRLSICNFACGIGWFS